MFFNAFCTHLSIFACLASTFSSRKQIELLENNLLVSFKLYPSWLDNSCAVLMSQNIVSSPFPFHLV